MSKRICELCGKEYECDLVIKCVDCFKKAVEVKNKTERLFKELAEANGWEATKRGYPDFICYRGDELVFVEVKSMTGKLTIGQEKFRKEMTKRGIKCLVWRPDNGFILR